MKLSKLIRNVLYGTVAVPSMALAQGYTVVPIPTDIQTTVSPQYQRGGLPLFSKYSRGSIRDTPGFEGRVTRGYIDENGSLIPISTKPFRKLLSAFARDGSWLDAMIDPTTFVIYSDKRDSRFIVSADGKKRSIRLLEKGHNSTVISVNSQGQVLLEGRIAPQSSSSGQPDQLQYKLFDGARLNTVYQTKLVANNVPSSGAGSYRDSGFIDDSSRWFLSGRHESGNSAVVYSGTGDGAVANMTEKMSAASETPKDFSWIIAAGKGLTVSTDSSQNMTVTSADGRLLAAAQGYDFALMSPNGDAFLNYKGSWEISLTRLTPSGLAAISCPKLGDGLNLLHAYKNGNLLIAKPKKSGRQEVYLLKKGGSDCAG